jgi:hypothetical protein
MDEFVIHGGMAVSIDANDPKKAFQQIANGMCGMVFDLMQAIAPTVPIIATEDQHQAMVQGFIGGVVRWAVVHTAPGVSDETLADRLKEEIDHLLPQWRFDFEAEKAGATEEGGNA